MNARTNILKITKGLNVCKVAGKLKLCSFAYYCSTPAMSMLTQTSKQTVSPTFVAETEMLSFQLHNRLISCAKWEKTYFFQSKWFSGMY